LFHRSTIFGWFASHSAVVDLAVGFTLDTGADNTIMAKHPRETFGHAGLTVLALGHG
jgi:hypothetical protein